MARMSARAGSVWGSWEGDTLQEALPPEMKAAPLRCAYQRSCRGDPWSFGTQCSRTLGSGGSPNSNCVPCVGLPHKRAHRHSSSCCGKELLGPTWVCRVPHPYHRTRVTAVYTAQVPLHPWVSVSPSAIGWLSRCLPVLMSYLPQMSLSRTHPFLPAATQSMSHPQRSWGLGTVFSPF